MSDANQSLPAVHGFTLFQWFCLLVALVLGAICGNWMFGMG